MTNILTILNIVSLLSSNPPMEFNEFLSHGTQNDIVFAEENNISTWDDYNDYISNENNQYLYNASKGKGDEKGTISEDIGNVEKYLNENYSEYEWRIDVDKSAVTSDVSNCIPIDMKTGYFPNDDIMQAIKNAHLEDKTSYGGCAPIAALGIMDYFARYLGYEEIIKNPDSSNERINLATEVLSNTHYSIFGNKDESLVWPWDYRDCFNKVMTNHGLANVISAKSQSTLFGGQYNNYLNQIVENVNKGLPVTLCTGMVSGDGPFAKHCTNVYGYETWVGFPNDGGDILIKKFLKARINRGNNDYCYCDAGILDCGQTAIITYNINYSKTYSFYDDDFSEEFVNDSGTGQYFFYDINEPVLLSNGMIIQTNRLRTSYIENEHLVLSPNRSGAGTAYLEITLPNAISELTFDASFWSGLEGTKDETFRVQTHDKWWKTYIDIDTNKLSTTKANKDSFRILFPKNTNRFRFYTSCSNPSGSKNKGRICLDNFTVYYN